MDGLQFNPFTHLVSFVVLLFPRDDENSNPGPIDDDDDDARKRRGVLLLGPWTFDGIIDGS